MVSQGSHCDEDFLPGYMQEDVFEDEDLSEVKSRREVEDYPILLGFPNSYVLKEPYEQIDVENTANAEPNEDARLNGQSKSPVSMSEEIPSPRSARKLVDERGKRTFD